MIKLGSARKRRRIQQAVAEAKHGFRSEPKMDKWPNIYGEESHLEPVDNTDDPFVLEQVSNKQRPSIASSEGSVKVDIDTPASLICIDPLLLIEPSLFKPRARAVQ